MISHSGLCPNKCGEFLSLSNPCTSRCARSVVSRETGVRPCGLLRRISQAQSDGLRLMPLQDVHLSHCSARLWRYIFSSFPFCELLGSGWWTNTHSRSELCWCRDTSCHECINVCLTDALPLLLVQSMCKANKKINRDAMAAEPASLLIQSAHSRLRRAARLCWIVFSRGTVFCWENQSTTTPGPLVIQGLSR